jgi:SAM-dependent methyltransferase
VTYCRNCKSKPLDTLWNLRDAPYGDLFAGDISNAHKLNLHPLKVSSCKECGLLQLGDVTDIEVQYDEYLYTSSVTFGLNSYYSEVSNHLLQLFPGSQPNVLDIGSNDGSFLFHFKKRGARVLGIEPARLAHEIASKKGIDTVRAYFSLDLALDLVESRGYSAEIVTINYALANVPNIHDVLSGIERVLAHNGVVSIITGYHPDQFAVKMFDYIGHDHLSYFSLSTLINCLERVNLKVIDAIRSENKGGSIQVIATKQSSDFQTSQRVFQILQRESWTWPSNESIFNLRDQIGRVGADVKKELGFETDKIIGVGASISTSYLINQFGIAEFIDFLVDDNVSKIGKFSPHYGIEVLSFSDLKIRDKRTAIVLAWQHTNVLINRLVEVGFKGKILVPLPYIRWVDIS